MKRFSILLAAAVLLMVCAATKAQLVPPQWSKTFADATIADSHSAVGVLVSVGSTARLLSPDGTLRWQVDLCPACALPGEPDHFYAGQLLADGSAWLLASKVTAQVPYRLLRILPSGTIGADIDIGDPEYNYLYSVRLLASASHATLLLANANSLRRIRFDDAGNRLETRDHALSAPRDSIFYTAAKVLADGGFAFAASYRNAVGCDFSPPICPYTDVTVYRVNADGSDRWQAEFPLSNALVAFDDEGSALINYFVDGDTEHSYLRDVDANGQISAPRPIVANSALWLAAGPVHGHYLAFGMDGTYLIDRSGAVLLFSPQYRYFYGVAAQNDLGYLVSGWVNDAADVGLLDPDTLVLRAEFNIDPGPSYGYSSSWSLLADGTVYGAEHGQVFPDETFRLARFAVPGTPAAERIFLDTFD